MADANEQDALDPLLDEPQDEDQEQICAADFRSILENIIQLSAAQIARINTNQINVIDDITILDEESLIGDLPHNGGSCIECHAENEDESTTPLDYDRIARIG